MTQSYNYGTTRFLGFGLLTNIPTRTFIRGLCIRFLGEVGFCPSLAGFAM